MSAVKEQPTGAKTPRQTRPPSRMGQRLTPPPSGVSVPNPLAPVVPAAPPKRYPLEYRKANVGLEGTSKHGFTVRGTIEQLHISAMSTRRTAVTRAQVHAQSRRVRVSIEGPELFIINTPTAGLRVAVPGGVTRAFKYEASFAATGLNNDQGLDELGLEFNLSLWIGPEQPGAASQQPPLATLGGAQPVKETFTPLKMFVRAPPAQPAAASDDTGALVADDMRLSTDVYWWKEGAARTDPDRPYKGPSREAQKAWYEALEQQSKTNPALRENVTDIGGRPISRLAGTTNCSTAVLAALSNVLKNFYTPMALTSPHFAQSIRKFQQMGEYAESDWRDGLIELGIGAKVPKTDIKANDIASTCASTGGPSGHRFLVSAVRTVDEAIGVTLRIPKVPHKKRRGELQSPEPEPATEDRSFRISQIQENVFREGDEVPKSDVRLGDRAARAKFGDERLEVIAVKMRPVILVKKLEANFTDGEDWMTAPAIQERNEVSLGRIDRVFRLFRYVG